MQATDAVDDTASSHGRGSRHDAGAGGGAGAGAGAGSGSGDVNATLRAVAVDGLKDLFAKSTGTGCVHVRARVHAEAVAATMLCRVGGGQ